MRSLGTITVLTATRPRKRATTTPSPLNLPTVSAPASSTVTSDFSFDRYSASSVTSRTAPSE